ncbi:hypothetical protein J6590_081198 [Homalodisca vitripennis]|nr:hypothetical protein J6590_081198 [Homalodisca vitripennis]
MKTALSVGQWLHISVLAEAPQFRFRKRLCGLLGPPPGGATFSAEVINTGRPVPLIFPLYRLVAMHLPGDSIPQTSFQIAASAISCSFYIKDACCYSSSGLVSPGYFPLEAALIPLLLYVSFLLP